MKVPSAAVISSGFTLDDGGTAVADAARVFGFANPCAGRRVDELPAAMRESISQALDETAAGDRMTLNVCFNYSGRAEIIDAVQAGATKAMSAMTASQEQAQNTVISAGQAGEAIAEITRAVARISARRKGTRPGMTLREWLGRTVSMLQISRPSTFSAAWARRERASAGDAMLGWPNSRVCRS